MKDRLIKMLQKANAGEIAAYHAYQGHWKALPPGEQRAKIQEIQKDELEHRKIVKKILTSFDAKPSRTRDLSFLICGLCLSFLSRCTGWLLPMKGALFIEKIGVTNYIEMTELAIMCGASQAAMVLLAMAVKEAEHQRYFEELLNA